MPSRFYVGVRVKGCFRRPLGDSVLRRKLLFGRDGVCHQSNEQVRLVKRMESWESDQSPRRWSTSVMVIATLDETFRPARSVRSRPGDSTSLED